jgi:hypothetical protein
LPLSSQKLQLTFKMAVLPPFDYFQHRADVYVAPQSFRVPH